MRKKSPQTALAAVAAALLLVGCHAVDAADVAQPTQEPPTEVTPEPAPVEAEPEATPEPTPEPTPAVDLNKTYTLEELYANNVVYTVLEKYGTLSTTKTILDDFTGDLVEWKLEYALDENGYVKSQTLINGEPKYITYQDNPYFKTTLSETNITLLSTFTAEGWSDPEAWLKKAWFGDLSLSGETGAAAEVLDSTYPENDLIVVQTHLDLSGADDFYKDSYEKRTYYVDPETDVVIKIVDVVAGTAFTSQEITDTTAAEVGKPITDTTAQVQSAVNAENGCLVNFKYIDYTILNWADRPPEYYTFQMRIAPGTTVYACYANGQQLGINSDAGTTCQIPGYLPITTDGETVTINGGP